MRPLKISAAVLCWLLIILAILFTVLDIQLSPESGAQQRFLRFYSEYGTEERFGIEPKQCAAALMAMIQYMRGHRDSIQITVSEYGSTVEMFNRQETDHMVDVKSLYQSFRKSQLAAIAAFVMVLLLSLSERKKGRSSITLRSLAVAVIIFFHYIGRPWHMGVYRLYRLLDSLPSPVLHKRPVAHGPGGMPHDTHLPRESLCRYGSQHGRVVCGADTRRLSAPGSH